ncbi:hypothetical protein EDB83DRAFT_1473229 [Lactarius deliciosus]|nr:hypothetical protein EDB83DRAFT_1473229 [Lactarius deliciosus]
MASIIIGAAVFKGLSCVNSGVFWTCEHKLRFSSLPLFRPFLHGAASRRPPMELFSIHTVQYLHCQASCQVVKITTELLSLFLFFTQNLAQQSQHYTYITTFYTARSIIGGPFAIYGHSWPPTNLTCGVHSLNFSFCFNYYK